MTALCLPVMHSAKNSPCACVRASGSERPRESEGGGTILISFDLSRLGHGVLPLPSLSPSSPRDPCTWAHGRANKFLNNHNSWFYGRNGARWPTATLSLFLLFLLPPPPLSLFRSLLSFPLRSAQSVAKQLVCFVRRPSDRLRADNRQTIRRGCFASEDSRRAISPAKLPSLLSLSVPLDPRTHRVHK